MHLQQAFQAPSAVGIHADMHMLGGLAVLVLLLNIEWCGIETGGLNWGNPSGVLYRQYLHMVFDLTILTHALDSHNHEEPGRYNSGSDQ